ncbi:MAG: hypothetical protein QXU47_08305 [Candidatus Bathyarchaeia archaeon]
MKIENRIESGNKWTPQYQFIPIDGETKQILEKSFSKRKVPRGFWKKILIDFLNSDEQFVELKIEGLGLNPRQIAPLLSSARNYLKLNDKIQIHLKKGKIYLVKIAEKKNSEGAIQVTM